MSTPPFQGLPSIPAMLTLFAHPRWVAWKHAIVDGRRKKPPVNPATGSLAYVDQPSTWGTYKAALARAQSDGLTGVGFVLNGEDELVGIDIDANKQTGQIDPELEEIARLGETYTERSPSGRGYRLFARGKLTQAIVGNGVEVYSVGRYLTVTGQHVTGTPFDIRPAPRTLEALKRRAGVEENTDQGGQEQGFARTAEGKKDGAAFWVAVNRAALDHLDRWVPILFPRARRFPKGWRVTSYNLGRNLEEDLSFTRDGIKDFGVHDLGDAQKGSRSPIEIVVEHGAARDHTEAAHWLCDRLGIAPESLGWIDWTKRASAQSDAEPTYPDDAVAVEHARLAVEQAIRQHLDAAEAWRIKQAQADNPFETYPKTLNFNAPARPPVQAIRVATGVGKTQTAVRLIAEHVKANPGCRFALAVPRHKLGDTIADLFALFGVAARVIRGRSANDPSRPGQQMCDDLDAVQAALDLGATVSTSCCKGKTSRGEAAICPFYSGCGYQTQLRDLPGVIIVAHEMLFTEQAVLGTFDGVFIDESFWQAGYWSSQRGLTLDEIAAALPPYATGRPKDVQSYRKQLHAVLDSHSDEGGIERRGLVAAGLTPETCSEAIRAEWSLKSPKAVLYPGMEAGHRRNVVKLVRGVKHIRAFTNVWKAARDLLHDEDENAVCGRLWLDEADTDEGRVRVVKTRGVKAIAKQWDAPTFIMDATLPSPEILKAFYPKIEVLADIDAAMPHVRVRQVLGAPVAKRKLFNGDSDAHRNLKALRRYILQRWLEVGRKPTLVIAQKDVTAWLRNAGLPEGIAVEHFNNVAGLDAYRDVRLLIAIGRTQPGPVEFEAFAGAITGREPVRASIKANGSPWFDKVERRIRLRKGGSVAVICDEHPDPTAEACRWQVCEGELIQALGRGRGVNRTSATPLDIDILTDVVLPITVDEARQWEEDADTNKIVEMLADGVVLTSPTDMAACWPEVWATSEGARDWLKARAGGFSGENPLKKTSIKGFPREFPLPPWFVASYRPAGRGQQTRRAWFNLDIIENPRAWLEARLGQLAHFEIVAAADATCAGTSTVIFKAAEPKPLNDPTVVIVCTSHGFMLREEPFEIRLDPQSRSAPDVLPLWACPRMVIANADSGHRSHVL